MGSPAYYNKENIKFAAPAPAYTISPEIQHQNLARPRRQTLRHQHQNVARGITYQNSAIACAQLTSRQPTPEPHETPH